MSGDGGVPIITGVLNFDVALALRAAYRRGVLRGLFIGGVVAALIVGLVRP